MNKTIQVPLSEEDINTLKQGTMYICLELFILPEMQHIKECMKVCIKGNLYL